MRSLLGIVPAALLASACSFLPPTPEPIVSMAPAADPAPAAANPAAERLLAAFRRDLQACREATRALKSDAEFVESFLSEEKRNEAGIAELLRQSKHGKHAAVRHLLRNEPYVELGVSYHGAPWAAAWVQNEAIYCAPTFRRLEQIEALGESPQAWEVRRYFLDKAVRSLALPGDAIGDGRVSAQTFEALVSSAARVYDLRQRDDFRAWSADAIRTLENRRQQAEGLRRVAALRESREALERQIAFLRGMMQGPEAGYLLQVGE